jgi:DNA-directed RNA polymerase subunit M
MKFCPKCGTTLVPTRKERNVLYSCPKCGYETKEVRKSVYKLMQEKEKVVIIGKAEQKIRTLPKVKVECPKCGHNEAFYWIVQTRGADESSTQFFRCTRCQYTWRELS